MIGFEEGFADSWNAKIVYAPNGFGKTTNANALNTYLNSTSNNSLLFTRRNIEQLVSSYGNAIYFGSTSNNAKNNVEIIKLYAGSNAVKEFFKSNYNTYSIRRLEQESFFFALSGIKKIDTFEEIIKLDPNCSEPIDFEKALKYDRLIDRSLYSKANELIV